VEYYVYGNGTVTTSDGTFVTEGGMAGLREYIVSISYQAVQFGNLQY